MFQPVIKNQDKYALIHTAGVLYMGIRRRAMGVFGIGSRYHALAPLHTKPAVQCVSKYRRVLLQSCRICDFSSPRSLNFISSRRRS